MRRIERASLLLLLCVGGCGASTGVHAPLASDASVAAPSCVGPMFGTPSIVTDPGGVATLDDVVVTSRGVVVVFTQDGLDVTGSSTEQVSTRLVQNDGTLGTTTNALGHFTAGEWGSGTAAARGERAAFVQWNPVEGCVFHALAPDGTAASPQVVVSPDHSCWALAATADGYAMEMQHEPDGADRTLTLLNAQGGAASVARAIGLSDRLARVVEPDGSFLELDDADLRASCGGCVSLLARHVDDEENTLAGPALLFTAPGFGSVFGSASHGSHVAIARAMAAWAPIDADAISVQPLDASGTPSGVPTSVPRDPGSAPNVGIAMLPDGDAVLAWIGTDLAHVSVAIVGPDGALRASASRVALEMLPSDSSAGLVVTSTTTGAMIVVQQGYRIVAIPVTCAH